MLKIDFVLPKSQFMNDVIALADANSKTLGHFPRKAFIEKAKEKRILIALIDNQLAGYILFRIVKSRHSLSITHLCINSQFRGKRIAVKLLDRLKELFEQKVRAFELNCLEEYTNASKLWKNYGFIPVTDKKSRSKSKDKNLINWQLSFNKPDLFTEIQKPNNKKLTAVLDLNILIKEREADNEVKYIQADWLKNEVNFYTCKESYSEILRDKNRERKNLTRKIKNKYYTSNTPISQISNIANELEINIITGQSKNDKSDRMQIAEGIAMEADYFITTDNGILNKAELILQKYNLNILSPISFVQEIDQFINTDNYLPIRLKGVNYTVKQVSANELNDAISKFNDVSSGEKQNEFRKKLHRIIVKKPHGVVNIITNQSNDTVAIFGTLYANKSASLDVIRLSKASFKNILFKHIIFNHINNSISKNLTCIEVGEKKLNEKQIAILQEFNFQKVNKTWRKLGLSKLIHSDELDLYLPQAKNFINSKIYQNLKERKIKNQHSLYEIERKFFPVKFKDLDIPTYIIPIRPYWASQLFDKHMASKLIFGSNPLLLWSRENIYYRSEKPISEEVPARILWYASFDKNYPRSSAIIGCSYLDNIFIDASSSLFQRFKRFGIYQWNEINKLAKGEASKHIKALKFSDTEVFKQVIPLKTVQEILEKKHTFQCPVKISRKVFNVLYNKNV